MNVPVSAEVRSGYDPDLSVTACRALWCAVIDEQRKLAVSPRNADSWPDITTARRWFGSRSFFIVCSLAGVDGDYVLAGVRRQLEARGVL